MDHDDSSNGADHASQDEDRHEDTAGNRRPIGQHGSKETQDEEQDHHSQKRQPVGMQTGVGHVHNEVVATPENVRVPQADWDDQQKGQDAVVVIRQDRELPVPPLEVEDEVLEEKGQCADCHAKDDQPRIGAGWQACLDRQVEAGLGCRRRGR